MKQKNGFTLVELLGVLVVLGIIAMVATPPIINQIKKANTTVSEANIRLLYSNGETYIKENNLATSSSVCFSVQTLIDNGIVSKQEVVSDNIKTTQNLIYTVDSNGKITYDLKLYTGCTK